MKPLAEYAAAIQAITLVAKTTAPEQAVTGIARHSGSVVSGDIFVAISGVQADGHDYIDEAVARGACAVVYSRDIQLPETMISGFKVADSYLAYALLCECLFDFPARELSLHGITGTNGKTTTAYLLEHILRFNGETCGLISTIECRCADKRLPATGTTPEAFELQQLFSAMLKESCTSAVMEVSSHGLAQHRPGGARFKTAVFTNLTGDHLDYHRDMESYFSAKKRLFTEYLGSDGHAVVNIDDPYGKRLAATCPADKTITFGRQSGAKAVIDSIAASSRGSCFKLRLDGDCHEISTSLIGKHNVYNLTGALCAAMAVGVAPESAIEALRQDVVVPGRLEHVRTNDVDYYIDYAHTDDALHNVLSILRRLARGRIITVFGCGGNRDRSKRPRMGAAAAESSDVVILTSDNPRDESPESIIDEIKAGIPDTSCLCLTEPDRRSAIACAIEQARAGDIVLIAGKGHETAQECRGRFTEFNDRHELLALLG